MHLTRERLLILAASVPPPTSVFRRARPPGALGLQFPIAVEHNLHLIPVRRWQSRATARRANLGANHPATLDAELQLGRIQMIRGDPVGGEGLILDVIERCRRRFGDASWPTTHARYVLAQAYADRHDARAATVFRSVLDHYGSYYGRDSRTYVGALRNFAAALGRLGWREAERDTLDELVDLERTVLGVDRAAYASAVARLQEVEVSLGHMDAARVLSWAYQDALEARRQRLETRLRRWLIPFR